ncbi:MAG TPA: hypothetical protein VL995_10230, partial [Cellvibrio sp.]|nr:hypothetical protein [Cellvibrio sp.]
MAKPERYYYGQGKIKIAEVIANVVGAYSWVGDVSAFSVGFAEEKAAHQESYSGQRSKVREFNISNDMTLNMTFHDFNAENKARFTNGTVTDIATGTVTAENLPNPVVVGTEYALANPGVSSVVITDSAGTPAVVPANHYTLDAAFGNLIFNSLPASPAFPFKVAYSYAARSQLAFLNASQKTYALKYEGVNLAEGGAPVIVELYRLSTGLMQELALITSGNALAGMQVSGSVLR